MICILACSGHWGVRSALLSSTKISICTRGVRPCAPIFFFFNLHKGRLALATSRVYQIHLHLLHLDLFDQRLICWASRYIHVLVKTFSFLLNLQYGSTPFRLVFLLLYATRQQLLCLPELLGLSVQCLLSTV